MPPKLSKNHTATALKDRSRHEKSTRKSSQVLHSVLFKAVDPAGLEAATPDYESGATNRLNSASHNENQ